MCEKSKLVCVRVSSDMGCVGNRIDDVMCMYYFPLGFRGLLQQTPVKVFFPTGETLYILNAHTADLLSIYSI